MNITAKQRKRHVYTSTVKEQNNNTKKKQFHCENNLAFKNMQSYSRRFIEGQNIQRKIAMNLVKPYITFTFQAIISIKTI